jgi:hypothetical protein
VETDGHFANVKEGGVTLRAKGDSSRSDNELMDELEEVLQRLGDAENVIEVIKYRLSNGSI